MADRSRHYLAGVRGSPLGGLSSSWSARGVYFTADADVWTETRWTSESSRGCGNGEADTPAWGFRNLPRLENRQGACGVRNPCSLSAGGEMCTETLWGHQEMELAVILTADCTELPRAQP